MTSTLMPWLKGSVRFAEVFVTQLQRCLLVCRWRCGELVWIGSKWILMMIYGSGNRNCLHKGHGLFCSIVLAYSKFLIPLPQLFKCENYGFSMTTLIVIFFTFLKTPCGFWIQACSFRCAKVSVHTQFMNNPRSQTHTSSRGLSTSLTVVICCYLATYCTCCWYQKRSCCCTKNR